MTSNRKKIMWIEDDRYSITEYVTELESNGFSIEKVVSVKDAINKIDENPDEYSLLITDIRMDDEGMFDQIDTHGGHKTGILIASYILSKYKDIKIIGFSAYDDQDVRTWFENHNLVYTLKDSSMNPKRFCDIVTGVLGIKRYVPKIFLVHGHDEELKEKLAQYIEKDLNFEKPVILSNEPNRTRTIIEKFEEEGDNVDIVFVLLTPDDEVLNDKGKITYRARQNVIFELGYFFGKMKRKNGNIIVCYVDGVEIPTDISGIAYINITHGLDKADKSIRKELSHFLDGGP